MAKHKRNVWFKRVRGSYLPITWQGRFVYLVYVVYLVAVPITWYRNGHHLWELLVYVLPLLLGLVLMTQYLASKRS